MDRFKHFTTAEKHVIFSSFISEDIYLTKEIKKEIDENKLVNLRQAKGLTNSLAGEINID